MIVWREGGIPVFHSQHDQHGSPRGNKEKPFDGEGLIIKKSVSTDARRCWCTVEGRRLFVCSVVGTMSIGPQAQAKRNQPTANV